MATPNQTAFALSLLLASLIIISGCTSSKYMPCCVKGGLYDDYGAELPSPKCYFPNGTYFGACTLDAGVTGAANCTDGSSCGSIGSEEECTKTASCTWDGSASPKCTGGQASWLLAVCQDLVPKSCVNDKCTAMVCGYASLSPAPPPASQDWDANKSAQDFQSDPSKVSGAMPADGITMPAVNLQGATCDFNTMNKKLYNKLTSSRGGLWVNSFRFGVGSSFSDYEAARNYFPATDRVCAANPYATIDRFAIYLNTTGTFCQMAPYYTCNKLSGVAFKDETTCQLYCGGGVAPYSCSPAPGTRYICNSDGFGYETEKACKQKCGIISDPNACTNDEGQFPFLDTDGSQQARYRLKYVSDYMVGTITPQGSQTCTSYGGPEGATAFRQWSLTYPDPPYDPYACLDYASWGDGPWFYAYNRSVWGDGYAEADYLGELRTYFDNHAYSSVDFDYDYYVKNLFAQYQGSEDAMGRLPYECSSGSECISGSCDTTYYKRPMCKDAVTDQSVACGCSKAQFDGTRVYYPSCNLNGDLAAMPAYADTGIYSASLTGRPMVSPPLNNYGPLFYPEHSVHLANGSATDSFRYYFPAPSGAAKPTLFEACGVSPSPSPKKMCVMNDRVCIGIGGDSIPQFTTEKLIWEAGSDGICHYSTEGEPCDDGRNGGAGSYYWEYSFNLNAMSGTVNSGQFGTCKMNGNIEKGVQTLATPPYLDTRDLGWCAPCTYATLAVQTVDFGAAANPGGKGVPRPYSCYEYRGEFNYLPDATTYPYGGYVGDGPSPQYDGNIRWGSATSPSTEIVRKGSNPSAYERDTDGNLAQGGTDGNGDYHFYCKDEWHGGGGWWSAQEIPTPSAPYLKEKLTSYLQSNVMPILDVQSSKTTTAAPFACQWGGADPMYRCLDDARIYSSVHACAQNCKTCEEAGTNQGYICPTSGEMFCPHWNGLSDDWNSQSCAAACFAAMEGKSYAPLSICNSMGGDGAAVHVVGNSTMLGAAAGQHGTIMPGSLDRETRRYLGLSGVPDGQAASLAGSSAILVRTSLLKQDCSTPPLTGIEIMPDEDAASLIGKGDLSDPANLMRGKLHKFFYNATEPGFAYRTANGIPDSVPDGVDMLLLDWYPMCDGQGLFPGENEQYEFESKMEFARAIMANFSKPMLAWKFAFPQNSRCNSTFFLDYMFNNTAKMVDSGLIGVIYSDWMMKDGLGYGPETRQYSDTHCYPGWSGGTYCNCLDQHNWSGPLSTGLTLSPAATRGSGIPTLTIDNPRSMSSSEPGKGELFCALQLFSRRAIGYIPLSYGQKLYAENQTCECQLCTDFDYITGDCDFSEKSSTDPFLPQIYCNDGAQCAMPSGRSDTGSFRCEDRCMNATACKLCSDQSHITDSSFCRITPVGGSTFGESMCYRKIGDDYWEFLAGLSPSEKCCLQSEDSDRSDALYTYTMMTGTKQQSEFLQFPGHGEQDIDCGRSPDTSVLEYCNIRVPISQKEIACMRVADAMCAADPNSRLLIAAAD